MLLIQGPINSSLEALQSYSNYLNNSTTSPISNSTLSMPSNNTPSLSSNVSEEFEQSSTTFIFQSPEPYKTWSTPQLQGNILNRTNYFAVTPLEFPMDEQYSCEGEEKKSRYSLVESIALMPNESLLIDEEGDEITSK
ncbi:hypothetical protein FRX31_007738 [Thalictrum thalictroides]|uniref:Uncharacterized protein n=1 Tax=Thalictrum thalictroides TaxID=46969 RepID=A0A7J6X1F9_THATH|nr:hypothetical protein FRX31_007738 [Thalictrum thalictroides]